MFFVHIPKTAGTSFRKAAESFYGSDNVLYDYSYSSHETSHLINDLIYNKKDSFLLKKYVQENDHVFLSGHVPANKYIHVFGARNTLTFLREPVQRVVSEYNHFVRHNGYKGSLSSFYVKDAFINRQSKMLHNIPLESLGFIGITEFYDECLAIVNSDFKSQINSVEMNLGRGDKSKSYSLPISQLQEIVELNQDDIVLYEKAKKIFLNRKEIFSSGLPFAHGAVQQRNEKSVSGWAWWSNSDEPVNLNVEYDGEVLANISATALRAGMLRLNLPRDGYVSFHVNFSKPIAEYANIVVKVADTGQILY